MQQGRIYALVTRGAGGHFSQWKFAKKVDKFWHQHLLAEGWVGCIRSWESLEIGRQPLPGRWVSHTPG